ncbi:hypothetical protein CTAYLR_008548 [Chrysophaeum taylorii]|uniref:SET domain-containing protein n=1 Tax=Chrysophaeum taylorii TaxID=2483200 RepID=A0AAD7XJV8_9STRA|nr:hypothetical protein CTAYLR_008548 [Chrysophaeum taylorii]
MGVLWVLLVASSTGPAAALQARGGVVELNEWIGTVCTSFDKVRVGECGERGWGLVAAKSIRRGDTVIEVPLAACLTSSSAREGVLGEELGKAERSAGEKFVPMSGEAALLALQIMDVAEAWREAMPEDPGLPLVLTEDAQCSSRSFAALRENAIDDYEWLRRHMWADPPSLDEWLRATSLALSRSFGVEDRLVLAPGVDFVNHDDMLDPEFEPFRLRKSFFGGEALAFLAPVDVATDEELRINYGPFGAAEFFETYGIVPSRGAALRAASACELRFELPASDRFFDDKTAVLERGGYDEPFLEVGVGGEVDPELMRFLRLRELTGTDAFLLEPVFEAQLWDDFLAAPISRPNEEACLEAIATECRAVADLLQKSTPPKAAPLLETVHQIELDALQRTLDWVTVDLATLDTKEYYQERRLRELGLDTEWSADDAQWSTSRAPGSVDW